MKINRIKFENFRIYKGINEITFSPKSDKNISIVAGKNGFGKTTFLTSLIWVFYGKMMSEVEDKYRKDIKTSGGYDKFLKTLLNRDVKSNRDNESDTSFSIEVELTDILIPSIPCKSVVLKRSYDIHTEKEDLRIFIDGLENELTKEVGYEVFINDFILPREIAKFFFFDAEKIVSLAEAQSKAELRNLSKAYSEVLGIKKYEDLKRNLETLLTKLRRSGASPQQQTKLVELVDQEKELNGLIEINTDKISNIEKEILSHKINSDNLQEKLIREGNGITLEELQEMKTERDSLKEKSAEIKSNLKKLLGIAPLVIAGKKLAALNKQLINEHNTQSSTIDKDLLLEELTVFSKSILEKLNLLELDSDSKSKVEDVLKGALTEKEEVTTHKKEGKILLDFTNEQFRGFEAVYSNIKGAFSSQFNSVIQDVKNNRILLSRVQQSIRQAEARKDNHLASKLRDEKVIIDNKIESLTQDKIKLIEELGGLKTNLASNSKVLSEYEKNFKLINTDQKKFEVTEKLLQKITIIIKKIKEDKKYSLQKSILLGLNKIMHKEDFIYDVRVNVLDDVMDIDLLDKNGDVMDKNSLSKGEQQLYATALLKALVDESGIKFPVFIDSPLQKFDKYHSKNIIKEFYPAISDQVVLFPLLEKELSELEYEYLKPNVNKVFVIENSNDGSSFKKYPVDKLFHHLKQEADVYSN
ncbi:DNA sulfur modification protein DndD [Formosa algae]|uniref:DNA sulfur modification protein DndD n=1 Tax=Formosa algae TaxID=225843 RepID=UPI000CCF5724|nr:DNA sulfur modification protein DndD [Formosa algae]PNW27806.1 DNA sulfur modification protein DndD [Formosa algae]